MLTRFIEQHTGARFLQLATHGYFLDESIPSMADARTIDQALGFSVTRSMQDEVRDYLPMTLCGLALAGTNAPANEFGRIPGKLNLVQGRHHFNKTYIGLFAGGGVKGGRIIGQTDSRGEQVVETGWKHRLQPKTENIYASVFSALGIDWRTEILDTPSKRAYRYVDHLGATEMCVDDEIAELFV